MMIFVKRTFGSLRIECPQEPEDDKRTNESDHETDTKLVFEDETHGNPWSFITSVQSLCTPAP